jgi:hypothetical protein
MGGVDLNDFLRQALYCIQSKIKFRKWYKMCFAASLDMAVTNSYILWKRMHPRSTHPLFLEMLSNQLLTLNLHEGIRTRTYTAEPASSVSVHDHRVFQYKVGEGYNGMKRNSKDCLVCKRDSTYYCDDCGVTACTRLHPTRAITCWNALHTSPTLKAKVERKKRRDAQRSRDESVQEKRLKQRDAAAKVARRQLMSP